MMPSISMPEGMSATGFSGRNLRAPTELVSQWLLPGVAYSAHGARGGCLQMVHPFASTQLSEGTYFGGCIDEPAIFGTAYRRHVNAIYNRRSSAVITRTTMPVDSPMKGIAHASVWRTAARPWDS